MMVCKTEHKTNTHNNKYYHLLWLIVCLYFFYPGQLSDGYYKYYNYVILLLVLPIFIRLLYCSIYENQKHLILLTVYVFVGLLSVINSSHYAVFNVMIITIMLLIISGRKDGMDCDYYNKYYLKNSVYYLFAAIPALFFIDHSNDGRYYLINGDPNHTAALYLSFILCLYVFSEKKQINKALLVVLFVVISFLTLSRMFIFGGLIFLFVDLLYHRYDKYIRFAGILLLLISVFYQYFAFFYFNKVNIYSDNLDHFSRLFDLVDNSNFLRTIAYYDALSYLHNNVHYLFGGSKYYMEKNSMAILVPHNWFLVYWFMYGLGFTVMSLIVYIYVVVYIEKKYLSVFIVIIFMGGILGQFPYVLPLTLFVLFACIYEVPESNRNYRNSLKRV